ncbi:hypothetical protein K883_05183 [Mycobacterium sp. TKK-01-0059]|uniref:sigma-70 family RNA polymerase sigma factor n=1 Tax=Mycobacterium sp. TKK-01-0059 TaxID=1324269 RepID=UPI0004D7047A|nr:sigma-70 family RNA polymerase sigma factor [Mycobacterium sp. TKK-01-0059]KEF94998.1 hypothetical protein K883_05183 [Mycobacterium sp. TKK-01-0059]
MQCILGEAALRGEAHIITPPGNFPDDRRDLARRFEREVIPLMAELSRRAHRMMHNRTDAEDLVQETMTRAYAGFGSYQRDSNARAWLHQIMQNVFVDDYRKRQRRAVEVLHGDLPDWHPSSLAGRVGARRRGAEDEALERLPDPQIKAAMEALPEAFRRVVYYADVRGYRGVEIARITSCPSATVASRLARGRRRLRALLIDRVEGSRMRARPASRLEASAGTDGEVRARREYPGSL